jgi:HTH-type transcriptional regulator / antitoxin HipB
MTYTSSAIQTLADLGLAVTAARKAAGLTATEVARRAGRSRDILYRLERGEDVSASSLIDLLQAIGQQLSLAPARLPTLDEARARFAEDDE